MANTLIRRPSSFRPAQGPLETDYLECGKVSDFVHARDKTCTDLADVVVRPNGLASISSSDMFIYWTNLLHARGLKPTSRVNTRVKWLLSTKPQL
jgi:hypothetical protein